MLTLKNQEQSGSSLLPSQSHWHCPMQDYHYAASLYSVVHLSFLSLIKLTTLLFFKLFLKRHLSFFFYWATLNFIFSLLIFFICFAAFVFLVSLIIVSFSHLSYIFIITTWLHLTDFFCTSKSIFTFIFFYLVSVFSLYKVASLFYLMFSLWSLFCLLLRLLHWLSFCYHLPSIAYSLPVFPYFINFPASGNT